MPASLSDMKSVASTLLLGAKHIDNRTTQQNWIRPRMLSTTLGDFGVEDSEAAGAVFTVAT